MKDKLRPVVHAMLNATAEGDDDTAQYRNCGDEEILADMWNYGDDLHDALKTLLREDLLALIQEWKAGREEPVEQCSDCGAEIIGAHGLCSAADDGPNYEKDES